MQAWTVWLNVRRWQHELVYDVEIEVRAIRRLQINLGETDNEESAWTNTINPTGP